MHKLSLDITYSTLIMIAAAVYKSKIEVVMIHVILDIHVLATDDISTENINQLSKKFPFRSKTSTVNQVSYKHQHNTNHGNVSRISRQFYVEVTTLLC